MIDTPSILRRLDQERRHLATEGQVIDVREHLTRIGSSDGSHHAVLFSDLNENNANATIEAEIEHHRVMNVEFEWKVYAHDRPANLRDRLARRGFEIGAHEVVLVFDLSRPAAWMDATNQPVTRVASMRHVTLFQAAAEEIFQKAYSFTAGQLSEGIRAGSTRHLGYIAIENDRAVSIGRLYTNPQSLFGGLYGGGTLPSHRGKGFYRSVVTARARDAMEFGAKYLIVDALPTSRPILERLGFEHLTDTWPCVWKPK